MANVTAIMKNVAKTTLWQSNESSYLKYKLKPLKEISLSQDTERKKLSLLDKK